MVKYKQFNNGLRLVVNKMEGMLSVSVGVLVKTGSMNENANENGISHFIEHVMFKGTKTRSAFEISDHIDRIGAQINAFTSKELTCYYTKSTKENCEKSLEILSDIFFNSVFDKEELEKEKGVIIEEINMSEDAPEEVCLDLLAESYYGNTGLGQTILGSSKNVKSFTRENVLKYMDEYYTADNVVISLAGNIDVDDGVELVKKYFVDNFTRFKSVPQKNTVETAPQKLLRTKRIEQTHIGFAMKGFSVGDEINDAFAIANIVFGGGMSSRLFQKIREELGLAYSVYSYASAYKDSGVLEIYAGVNTELRDLAVEAILAELKRFKTDGVTEQEFARGKEQIRSAFIMGQESTSSQMLLYAKNLILLEKEFDFNDRMKRLEDVTMKDVKEAIERSFDANTLATATVGTKRSPLKIF